MAGEDLRHVLKAGVAFHRPWRGNDHNALFGAFKSDSLEDDDAAKSGGAARKWIGDQIDRLPFVESIKKGAEAGMDKVNQRFRGRRDDTETGLPTDAEPGSAWESVQIARNVHRPTASSYVKVLSPSFLELHGDREFADDKAIVAGLGRINGRPSADRAAPRTGRSRSSRRRRALPSRSASSATSVVLNPKVIARRRASCVRPRSSTVPSFVWSTRREHSAAWKPRSEVRATP